MKCDEMCKMVMDCIYFDIFVIYCAKYERMVKIGGEFTIFVCKMTNNYKNCK